MIITLCENEEIDILPLKEDQIYWKLYSERIPEKNLTFKLLHKPNLDGVESVQGGLLDLYSNAYSYHRPVVFAPHDVWHIVLTELATIIKDNTEVFRPLFTRSPDKIEIIVQGYDILDFDAVINELHNLVPVDPDIFLPEFTTQTPGSRCAQYAAFCDALQNYYSYATFLCGIPKIQITGTDADWGKIETNLVLIQDLFRDLGVNKVIRWLETVTSYIQMVRNTLAGGSQENWINIFSQQNVGSGGQKAINGWISEFWYNPPRDRRIEGFAATWVNVPYYNVNTKERFRSIQGPFFQKRNTDGFVYADYAQIIFQEFSAGVSPSFNISGALDPDLLK